MRHLASDLRKDSRETPEAKAYGSSPPHRPVVLGRFALRNDDVGLFRAFLFKYLVAYEQPRVSPTKDDKGQHAYFKQDEQNCQPCKHAPKTTA